MKVRRIVASAGLLLAGIAWPLAVNGLAVRARFERQAEAAEDALLEARAIRKEIEIARERYEEFAAAMPDLERRQLTFRRQLPVAVDRPAAVADLQQAAATSGVALLSWEEKPAREQPSWREVPIEATLEGPTAAIFDLAKRMAARAAHTELSRLNLTPARPGFARAKLEITLFALPIDTHE